MSSPDERFNNSFEPCPDKPCAHCVGTVKLAAASAWTETVSSWEWCQYMNACAASIDWDKVYGHD